MQAVAAQDPEAIQCEGGVRRWRAYTSRQKQPRISTATHDRGGFHSNNEKAEADDSKFGHFEGGTTRAKEVTKQDGGPSSVGNEVFNLCPNFKRDTIHLSDLKAHEAAIFSPHASNRGLRDQMLDRIDFANPTHFQQ